MNKLLSASLYKMKKDFTIKLLLLISFIFPIFLLVSSILSLNITNALIYKYLSQFFGHSAIIGIATAILAAKSWGQDYDLGTMRVKIARGHNRMKIYLDHFISVSMVAFAMVAIWIFVYMSIGLPVFGLPNMSVTVFGWYIFTDILLVIAMSAVCNFIASISSGETKALLICLVVVMLMLVIGLILYKRFSIPQYNGWTWYDNDPTPYPNQSGLYVGGVARLLLESIMDMIPGVQGIVLMNQGVEHLIIPPTCSVMVIILSLFVGIRIFMKRDIK